MIKFTAISLTGCSGVDVELSYQSNLIMMHSADICAQWSPDAISVRVFNFDERTKLDLTTHSKTDHQANYNHQTFYFEAPSYDLVCNFFRKLNFPEQCYTNLTKIKGN